METGDIMINKFNELDKKYKILIIVSILILLLIILTKIFSKSPEQQLKDYLVKNDYINEYKSNTYSKQISESNLDEYYENKEQEKNSTYEINSINVKKHTFSKNKRNFMNNTEDTLNEEYTQAALKKLKGVNAVQTYSRLNRICPPYDKKTFILDFVPLLIS